MAGSSRFTVLKTALYYGRLPNLYLFLIMEIIIPLSTSLTVDGQLDLPAPGPGNFIPHLFRRLLVAFRDNDQQRATELQNEINEFRQFARQPKPFVESGFHFSTFKAGLDVMGIGGGTPALPYQPLPKEFHDALRPFFVAAGACRG